MGFNWRLFGPSKLRYRSIIINPFTKQSHRDLHDFKNHNPNPNPTKFLLKRLYGNTNDLGGDYYLFVLSTDAAKRISPEKNLYYFSPRAPPVPPCPFALFGGNNNNNSTLSLKPRHDFRLVSSCNGLICLETSYPNGNVVVWNPFTDAFRVIGYSSIKRPRCAYSTYFECVGFGFDPVSEDFKVIVDAKSTYDYIDEDGHDIYDGTESHYEVYSLKNGSSHPLRLPSFSLSLSPCSSVYINGFYYWNPHPRTNPRTGVIEEDLEIRTFNFANEAFSSIRWPRTGKPIGPYKYSLVDYGGLLCFVIYPEYGTEKKFDLWVRENERTWSKVDYPDMDKSR